jgi:NADH-quinone oxidoreductase subunit J
MAAIFFFIAAIGAIAGAVGVVALRNPFYSVLALVFHLVSLSLLFLLLQAQFVAAAQVIVYAGAVMVLYVFVVAYVGGNAEPVGGGGRSLRVLSIAFAAVLFVELAIAVLGTGLEMIDSRGPNVGEGFGAPAEIGKLLLTDYLLAFELASFLLLTAAVGAVALARRRRGMENDYATVSVTDVFRMGVPSGFGSQAESVGRATGKRIPVRTGAEPEGEE